MKNHLILVKLDSAYCDYLRKFDNKVSGKLGAINFNNMLPVKKNNIIKIDLDKEPLTKSE